MQQTIGIYWQKELETVLPPVMDMLEKHFPMFRAVRMEKMAPAFGAYDPSRYQYDAAGLLKELPKEGVSLYLVHVDLYHPGYRYLYGAAASGRAVASDFRPDTAGGFYKEICHELGHALGLGHCRKHCVMHVSRSERQLEKKHEEFCSRCRRELEGVQPLIWPAGRASEDKEIQSEEVNVS